MGKVYLNENNELVIETNNGRIEGRETTTVISSDETFEIDVTSLSKLLAIMNDLTLSDDNLYHRGYYYTIISKERLAECVKKERSKWEQAEGSYTEIKRRFDNLVKRVKKHNSEKKLFWKPINIDDVCVN